MSKNSIFSFELQSVCCVQGSDTWNAMPSELLLSTVLLRLETEVLCADDKIHVHGALRRLAEISNEEDLNDSLSPSHFSLLSDVPGNRYAHRVIIHPHMVMFYFTKNKPSQKPQRTLGIYQVIQVTILLCNINTYVLVKYLIK